MDGKEGFMAQENAKRFMELMRTDEEIRKKVKTATEAYIGDKLDEKALFETVIAPVAREAGLEFTFEEVVEFAQKPGNDELAEDELAVVAGGKGNACVIIGGGHGKGAGEDGAGACEYVGVGWGFWS